MLRAGRADSAALLTQQQQQQQQRSGEAVLLRNSRLQSHALAGCRAVPSAPTVRTARRHFRWELTCMHRVDACTQC